MEEIKKTLESLKSEIEEAQEVYLSKLETAIASIKNALEAIPKPLPVPIDIEKLTTVFSSYVKPQVVEEHIKEPEIIPSFKHSLMQIDKGKTQVEILDALLKEASIYASRVALFIFKGEQAVGWKGYGFTKLGSDDMKIKTIIFPLSEGNPFYNSYKSKNSFLYQPLSEDLISKTLGGPKPEKILIVPLIIKDKVSACLYCDEIKGAINLNIDILEILTFVASLSISLIGQRQILPSPTLSVPNALKAETLRPSKPEIKTTPPPPPPKPVAPPPVPPVSPERTQRFDLKTMQELEALKKETIKKPIVEMLKTAPTIEVPKAPPKPPEPPVMEKVPEKKVEVEEPYQEIYEIKAEEVYEVPEEMEYKEKSSFGIPKEEYEVPEAPPPSEWAEFKEEPIKKPEPMVVPPPPPPPPPVENIEEIYAKKSVEVKPPADFKKEKPGFGFEAIPIQPGLTPEESKRHDEARRFARLLVSEIKLYNENKVEEGRRNKNIYSLLKEDIDRSKQLYEERIAADVRAKSDYFKQALISILANGDSSALGAMDF